MVPYKIYFICKQCSLSVQKMVRVNLLISTGSEILGVTQQRDGHTPFHQFFGDDWLGFCSFFFFSSFLTRCIMTFNRFLLGGLSALASVRSDFSSSSSPLMTAFFSSFFFSPLSSSPSGTDLFPHHPP